MQIINNLPYGLTNVRAQYRALLQQIKLFLLYLFTKTTIRKDPDPEYDFITPMTNPTQRIKMETKGNKNQYIPIDNASEYISNNSTYITKGCLLRIKISENQLIKLQALLNNEGREHYTFTPKGGTSYYLHHYLPNEELTDLQELQIPQHDKLICCFGKTHPYAHKHLYPNNAPIGVEIIVRYNEDKWEEEYYAQFWAMTEV